MIRLPRRQHENHVDNCGTYTAARGRCPRAQGPPGEVINQARKALAVTPSDTVDLTLGADPRAVQRWRCGLRDCRDPGRRHGGGDAGRRLPSGTFMPIRAKRVMATNTVCTGIVGLW